MKAKILILSMLAPLFAGCLDKGQTEAELKLSSDKEEVFVVADVYTGDGELSKTIRITSNKSWSAHLNDLDNPIDESDPTQTVPWGSLSVEEHPNVTGLVDEVEVTVNFNRNYSKQKNNGVLNIYSDGKLRKSVKLEQAGVVYSLKASYEGENPVSDNGGMISIGVTSNTSWTAKLDPGSTADAVLLTDSGTDEGEVRLRLRANDDAVTKNLKVVFSAEGMEDVTVDLTQKEVDPTIKFFNFNTTFGTELDIATPNKKQVPKIILNEIPEEVRTAGVKFYYEKGTEGFTDDLIPSEESDEFPEGGVLFATQTEDLDEAYVVILATCPGYRPVYLKVHARHWRFGSANITKSGKGVTFSKEPTEAKSGYVVLNSSAVLTGSKALTGGSACAYLLSFTSSSTSQSYTFLINGVKAGAVSIPKGTTPSNKPLAFISEIKPVEKNQDICFENTGKKKASINAFASLEQITFKP